MKSRLEEKLKLMRDNLILMQDLYKDPETPDRLRGELYGHMLTRVHQIEDLKKSMKLIPINNIFHEAIQFDIEGRYPNSANV